MAPAAASGAVKPRSGARRGRSSSQRRKVEAELRARDIHNKDVFALQQRLLLPGASRSLMDAARGLLQAKDYEAVVEERALESLCGFPPCRQPSAGKDVSKSKWCISVKDKDANSAEDFSSFCSLECMRDSGAFTLRLEPEPAYIRPASAVAASRGAVAEADAAAETKDPSIDPTEGSQSATTAPDSQGKRPLPKVRQKAVVRFSRTDKTYTVQYDDYDGGGALPGVASTADPAAPSKKDSPSIAGTAGGIRGLLDAKICERQAEVSVQSSPEANLGTDGNIGAILAEPLSAPAGSGVQEQAGSTAAEPAASATGAVCDIAAVTEEANGGGSDPDRTEGTSEADDEPLGFFEAEVIDAAAHQRWQPDSSFVRAWGVFTSWLTEPALETIHRGALPELGVEEERPDHMSRRALLTEVLMQRIPGPLSALATRVCEVVAAIGIHQPLPPVTETDLYDLFGNLLLGVLLQVEVTRGSCSTSTATEGLALLRRKVDAASRNLGITAEELATLEAHFGDQGSRGYIPVRPAA